MSESTMPDIVQAEEVDYFIKSLRKFQVTDIGDSKWFDVHEILLKLNQQSIIEARAYREEVVKELLITNNKLKVIVHEAYCILLWKTKVLPKILIIEPNPKATFVLYTVLYHEATAISFLETVLYHENSFEALGDVTLDLIDYCTQAITQLIGLVNIRHHEIDGFDVNESVINELERQRRDLDYKIGMKCVTVLSYIINKLEKCPLSAVIRLVQIHDVPCLLSEILHLRPWLRKLKGFEKFIDDKWVKVQGDDMVKLTKTEAQTWFALRQILFNPNVFQYYELNDFRQRELSKCQALLNDQILDQVPPLAELKQYLCRLTVSGHKNKDNLILEELPEIRNKLVHKAKKIGWNTIAEQHVTKLLISDQTELNEMARRLNSAYSIDVFAEMESPSVTNSSNKCAACKKDAIKKCSQCETIFYCSRDCQIKDWKNHKPFCCNKKNSD